jgi:Rod binding domain-containing protein
MNPLTAISKADGAHTTTATRPEPRPEVMKAAREFETIFLRSLLGSLEKTTSSGTTGSAKTGQSTYGSMVVGALADSMSGAGGIGLAEVIARAMTQSEFAQKGGAKGP